MLIRITTNEVAHITVTSIAMTRFITFAVTLESGVMFAEGDEGKYLTQPKEREMGQIDEAIRMLIKRLCKNFNLFSLS